MNEFKKVISVFLVVTIISTFIVPVYAEDNENELFNTDYIASVDIEDLDNQPNESDRIIVKFKDGSKKTEPRRLKSKKLNYQIAEEQQIRLDNADYSIITPNEDENMDDLIQSISREYGDNIDIIQPDYIIGSYAYEDGLFVDNIELENTEVQAAPITQFDSLIPDWSNVGFEQNEDNEYNFDMDDNVVAVIDTAIDYNHSALLDSIYVNSQEVVDGIDNDGNGYIDDIYGWDFINSTDISHSSLQSNHGTHVAGLVVADGIGVGTNAKILPLNVFNDGVAYTSDIVEAIKYAESMGAKVVNCSWGSSMANPILEDAIRNSNMLFVCAAGNSGVNIDENPIYPASYDLDNILTVGATNDRDYLTYFSNYGDSVDITANGYKVNSSFVNNHYGIMTGTSMSAAYVSGLAARVYKGSAIDTKNLIIETSDRVSTLINKVNLGRRVNLINALDENINDSVIENTQIDYDEEHYQQIKSNTDEYRLFDLDPEIAKVYAGLNHSVTINNWGLVNTFGDDTYNQLGEKSGTYGAISYCHAVAGLDYIEKVSTFANHNLALSGYDGTVFAWGDNSRYQLGQINGSSNAMPAEVEFFKSDGTSPKIIDIIAGGWYSLALDDEGNVWGWGDNTYGQMAQGYTGYRLSTPRIIMSGVSSISAGKYHVLAVKNGIAYGWGRNAEDYALGENAEWSQSTPIQIAGLPSDVYKVVAGDRCSFFFTSDGVYVLGANENGQLGDGTTTNKSTPQLLNLSGVQDVLSNGFTLFNCGNTYYVCGANNYGQLGQGYPNTRITTPVVLPINDAQVYNHQEMAIGGYHGLFFAVNGSYPEDEWYYRNARVYATGRNHIGQCLGYRERYVYPTIVYEVENSEDLGDFEWDNMHLRPIDSTYVSQHGDDTQKNFYNNSLKVRYTGNESDNSNWGEYSYLKFDLSNIEKERLSSAKLNFYVLNTGDFRESTREIGIYDTYTNDWNGQTMTWSNGKARARDLIGSFTVSANGYMISPSDIGWHEVDITDYLKYHCIDDTLSLTLKSISTQAYETVIESGALRDSYEFMDMHMNSCIPVLSLEYDSEENVRITRNSYTPANDTYIYQHNPNNSLNFSDSGFLYVNYTDSSRTDYWGQDSYISFNMDDLNESERNSIISAKLWVYVDDTSDTRSSTRTLTVTGNEGWNYSPATMTWNSGRPNGNYQVGEFTVHGNGFDITDPGWKAIDVTDFLKSISNNKLEFIIKMTSTQAHPVKIRSNEYSDISTRPRLVIDIDKQYNNDTIDKSDITLTNGTPYTYAVTVSDMENIQNKIFTVNFDNSKLSLVDVCAQTWGNDVSIGDVADTDIRILAVTSSSVKFKINKSQSPVSGCVNLIKFNALASGTTTITVTTEN